MKKIKVFGIVRYSVLTDSLDEGPWAVSNSLSFSDLEKTLFEKSRLLLRFYLFKKVTLPSLAANLRDWADFRVLVITSVKLPEKSLYELHSLCNQYDFVNVFSIGVKDGAMDDLINSYIEEEVNKDEVYFTFRIDDDDALAWDYTDIIRPYLSTHFVDTAISLPLGYSGFFDPDKQQITLYGETYSSMTALGLGLISTKNSKFCHVFDIKARGGHYKTDRVVPVLLLSAKHAYLRVLHAYGDMYHGKNARMRSERTRAKTKWAVSKEEIMERVNLPRDFFAEQPTDNQHQKRPIRFMVKHFLACIIRCFEK